MSFDVKQINSDLAFETSFIATHSSGLKVYLCEKKDFSANYAVFGTHYGSIDCEFAVDNKEPIRVPEGIAHFLEHKLFESEDGDAFTKFAVTGASANAYTSFDRTCYLFNCSENFYENLDILLNFVSSPYFTAETVKKEQGIIGQEIRMYDDAPSWCVLFNLLRALYHNHPVKIDIAGTVESIAKITDKTLYDCYNTFYNPSNMFLCICGNFDIDRVLTMIDEKITASKKHEIKRIMPIEPKGIVTSYIEKEMPVALPMFVLGIKDNLVTENHSTKHITATDLLLELCAGRISPLYDRLLNEGLINNNFSTEYFYGFGYSAILFDGESAEPEKVKQAIINEISNIAQNGVDPELFEDARRKLYGRKIRLFSDVEETVNVFIDCAINESGPYDTLDVLRSITAEDVNLRAKSLDLSLCALSVIKPQAK